MANPYYYVKFRWLHGLDMKEVARGLGEDFGVETLNVPYDIRDLTLYKDHREELRVAADTLLALLSPTRAVLYQKESASFTARDMELRRRILELYPRSRVTPLPIFFRDEPRFEIAEETDKKK